jgi:hypothetical protein
MDQPLTSIEKERAERIAHNRAVCLARDLLDIWATPPKEEKQQSKKKQKSTANNQPHTYNTRKQPRKSYKEVSPDMTEAAEHAPPVRVSLHDLWTEAFEKANILASEARETCIAALENQGLAPCNLLAGGPDVYSMDALKDLGVPAGMAMAITTWQVLPVSPSNHARNQLAIPRAAHCSCLLCCQPTRTCTTACTVPDQYKSDAMRTITSANCGIQAGILTFRHCQSSWCFLKPLLHGCGLDLHPHACSQLVMSPSKSHMLPSTYCNCQTVMLQHRYDACFHTVFSF